jgi:dihydroorotase
MLVAVHAEDEALIKEKKREFNGTPDYAHHSSLRNEEVAVVAVEKAISLTRQYGTRLYVLHTSTADEVALIRAAKQENLPVYAETTPHHLFLDTSHYDRLHGRAVVNPPLRAAIHHEALFNAIRDGVIDTIGSDHAPHTLEEKSQAYGMCPSGMPGIEFMLPLLLNAHHQGRLSLEQVVSLTSSRAKTIFQIQPQPDYVLVDLNREDTVTNTVSKCGWTSYQGMKLSGWPVYTVLGDHCYSVDKIQLEDCRV